MKRNQQRSLVLLIVALAVTSCRQEPFDMEQRYKHDLVGQADCQRIHQGSAAEPEFSCAETAVFYPDGQVDLLLGGGDIMQRGSYRRKGKTITINGVGSQPGGLQFRVLSETTLIRQDNNTRWQRY